MAFHSGPSSPSLIPGIPTRTMLLGHSFLSDVSFSLSVLGHANVPATNRKFPLELSGLVSKGLSSFPCISFLCQDFKNKVTNEFNHSSSPIHSAAIICFWSPCSENTPAEITHDFCVLLCLDPSALFQTMWITLLETLAFLCLWNHPSSDSLLLSRPSLLSWVPLSQLITHFCPKVPGTTKGFVRINALEDLLKSYITTRCADGSFLLRTLARLKPGLSRTHVAVPLTAGLQQAMNCKL